MSFYSLLVLISFIASAAIIISGALVKASARGKDVTANPLAYFAINLGLLNMVSSIFYTPLPIGFGSLLFKLSHILSIVTSLSLYYLSFKLRHGEKQRAHKHLRTAIAISLLAIAGALFLPIARKVSIEPVTKLLIFDYDPIVYGLVAAVSLALTIAALINIAKGRATAKRKATYRGFVRATMFTVICVVFAWFILPTTVEVLELEIALSTIGIGFYAYYINKMILKGWLVSLRKNSTRVFVRYVLDALYLILFSIVIAMIESRILEERFGTAFVAVFVFAGLLVGGLLLINRAYNYRLSISDVSPEKANQKLRMLLGLKNESSLAEAMQHIVLELYSVESVLIAYMNNEGSGQINIKSNSVKPTEKELIDAIDSYQKAIHKDEIVELVERDVSIGGINYELCFYLKNKDYRGLLLVGDSLNGFSQSEANANLLKQLALAFLILLSNAKQYAQINEFSKTLEMKIHTATSELRKTNEKLKALDETKDEFISMASHQLRTPLTSVKGYLSMVLEGDAGELNDQQRKLLDQAFTSSQRMVYLISDLLNVSRLRTGKFIIEPAATNLADVVEGEVSQLIETAAARGLELVFDKPQEFPVLHLDETKIRQVIMNFIDNAIYYTPSGGRITVQLKTTDAAVEYTVNDTGLGVPKKDQHHLFTKFYRAENAKRARPDGTGLGLFMAKKVVIAQGGAIIFRSQEGKGSTFGFVFPRQKLEPAAKPAKTAIEA